MTKRPAKDPNAPKRNMSAYLLYQNAMRDQFKAINPTMSFGELSKYTSAMYAELPQSEKEAWISRAEADKARYLHELASYMPPPGYDAKGDAVVSQIAPDPPPRRKPERDPNAPKRNLSAYLLYQNAMRDQFRRENPGMTFGQLSKYTSHMYKNLTQEEKASWEARSVQDKARYDAEMENYTPPLGHDARGVLIDDHPRKKAKRAPKDPLAPKRATGAYVFFTNEYRPKIMLENPGIKFVDLGRVLGERWRNLDSDEKKRYEDMAIRDKRRFQVEQEQYEASKASVASDEHDSSAHAHHDPTEFYDPAAALSYDPYHADVSHDPYGQHFSA